jgi:hypothetical protein
MAFLEKVVESEFWKNFRIPAFAFALIALLLLMRNTNDVVEWIYIQETANFALGACIISYGHWLMRKTWESRTEEPDLPFWAQFIALAVHVGWFARFLFAQFR